MSALKERCPQELPSREAVREVVRVADAHWRHSPHTFIAIHCAYGDLNGCAAPTPLILMLRHSRANRE